MVMICQLLETTMLCPLFSSEFLWTFSAFHQKIPKKGVGSQPTEKVPEK